jgi:hypothetical protein
MVYNICMKRINCYLTEQEIKELQAISRESGLSFAELIRRAIDKWIEARR